MSSNTIQRILSAVFLIALVGFCFYLGEKAAKVLIGIVGLIIVDEIYKNFFKKSRKNLFYFISVASFASVFLYFNFLDKTQGLLSLFNNSAIGLNVLLIVYLFYIDMEHPIINNLGKKWPFLSSVFALLPLMSLTSLFIYPKWIFLFLILLVINFGMDTGAWFFGKNFGKNKLWPKVSPGKTIEGLLGGILTSGVLGGITWHFVFEKMSVLLFFTFCLLGLLAQVGDLIQSKFKRQSKIKDSSRLIPGHGGVYDRLDSLLFSIPFYVTIVSYYFA